MTATDLLAYAESEIDRLDLGDTETNCHGVVAHVDEKGVRLSDGVGLDEIATTREEIDGHLETMADWYAESE